jgi:two-component system, chemotaxis family, sensor kinase CheA
MSTKDKQTLKKTTELLNKLACETVVGATPIALQTGFSQVEGLFKDLGLEPLRRLASLYVVGFFDAAPAVCEQLIEQAPPLLEFFTREVEAWELGKESSDGVSPWLTRLENIANGLPAEAAQAEQKPVSARSEAEPQPVAPPKESGDDALNFAADPEFVAMFITEALDHLESIEALVLEIEKTPDNRELLDNVFRPFHTVKGNAGALGFKPMQELAHKVENLLDLARKGKHKVGPEEIDIILKAVDLTRALLGDLKQISEGKPGKDFTTLRLALQEAVDRVIAGGGAEVPQAAPQIPSNVTPAEAVSPVPAAGDGMPKRRASDFEASTVIKVDASKLDNLIDMVGELVIIQSMIRQDPTLANLIQSKLSQNLSQLNRITSSLQKDAMSLRMVPVRQTFQKMSRLVRDLGSKSGKKVELALYGEDTEMDRKMVEEINDPLMHMIRNAVDHGIEKPATRAERNKPATARVELKAYHQGGNIVIEISDDGNGLDPEKIRKKAISQGLVTAEQELSEAEIFQLIFAPGFSTAEKITEISGRGVGMDVVRRNIEALRGKVEIQSVLGKGSQFLIKLPLTLAILDGLVLGVGAERFVLPTFAIKESLRPTKDQIHSVQGRECMVRVRDRLFPLVRISVLFGIDSAVEDPCQGTLVLIEDDDRQLCLLVDRLIGKQEVVIKSLGETFRHLQGVAGGAILGDGRVGLILDANGIFRMTQLEKAS